MNTTIKKNDSFDVLSTATGINRDDLEQKIIDTLISEQLIEQHFSDYGRTIQDILELSEWKIEDFVEVLGWKEKSRINKEIPELLSSILIWGDASEHPCPECGCEMEATNDGIGTVQWVDFKCENPNCNHAESGEPDWDTMPGGIDYDNQ
jgi:hypothetical protein